MSNVFIDGLMFEITMLCIYMYVLHNTYMTVNLWHGHKYTHEIYIMVYIGTFLPVVSH